MKNNSDNEGSATDDRFETSGSGLTQPDNNRPISNSFHLYQTPEEEQYRKKTTRRSKRSNRKTIDLHGTGSLRDSLVSSS